MAKIADKYFEVDKWKIIERGFNPNYGKVAESIFSIANEYMGIRGYFEEGYSGEKLIGSYFNGIYERTKPDKGHYKGIVDFSEYMVNSVDWLYTVIEVDGKQLDVAKANISEFERVLDMQTGMLTRSFVWTTEDGKKISFKFERVLSMENVDTAAQRITIKANKDVQVVVSSGIDFNLIHQSQQRCMWRCDAPGIFDEDGDNIFIGLEGRTVHTKQKIYSSCKIEAVYDEIEKINVERKSYVKMKMNLSAGEERTVSKVVKNLTYKTGESKKEYNDKVEELVRSFGKNEQNSENITNLTFDSIAEDSKTWWTEIWKTADIVIEGDDENQQGIRFCIFQLFQTYHGAVRGTNIGAKGLTGEAYSGNAFWDTETYCLPFYIFNNKEAATNLLYFRYKTLDEARKRAKDLDCEGAFYPIATISGKECCNLWQHASLQLQATTAVAYAIWFYEKMYNDKEFMKDYGLEMLIEISRMLVTRGDYSPEGKYGYYSVMGPDEFQMMVNNNCYTNYMGKFALEYAVKVAGEVSKDDAKKYKAVAKKVGLKDEEIQKWIDVAENMYIPYDEETMLFEQHDGFFKLPHLDVDAIPVEDFPLYYNWSYDRIYRNDMIKQPDVLMFMLLFNSQFSNMQLRANYEYYEPRCIHESSLSPSVHSILASQLHKNQEAYDFFGFATRMDLDNYNRNTGEGIHTTSIAAAWMNIVYGFGGVRTDGDILTIAPSIPEDWTKYSFKIGYEDDTIEVEVSKNTVKINTVNNSKFVIKVYDAEVQIDGKGYTCLTK